MVLADDGDEAASSDQDNIEIRYMNANGILVDSVQLEKEQNYVIPTEPETKTKTKINKIAVKSKFESA